MKPKQTNIIMAPEIHQRLKISSVMSGRTMGDTIEYMLNQCFPLEPVQNLALSLLHADEEKIGKK